MTSALRFFAGSCLVVALAGAAGCVPAAAAAGAGAGVYLTSRGASAVVKGSIEQVAQRAETVLVKHNVTISGRKTEEGGAQRELSGPMGEIEVTVEMQSNSATTTHVEVTAKKSAVQWDKDTAKRILTDIVAAR